MNLDQLQEELRSAIQAGQGAKGRTEQAAAHIQSASQRIQSAAAMLRDAEKLLDNVDVDIRRRQMQPAREAAITEVCYWLADYANAVPLMIEAREQLVAAQRTAHQVQEELRRALDEAAKAARQKPEGIGP